MTLSTYAGLLAKLTDSNDFNISSADAADLITLAEARIAKEVRHRHMEKALSVTISNGTAAIPSDYIALKHAYVSRTPVVRLKWKPAGWIYENYAVRSGAEVPQFIGSDGGVFIFGPSPGTYTIVGSYYYRFAALSSATNNLFLENPDLYLFACYAEAEPFIGRESRLAVWEAKYEKIKTRVNNEDRFGSAGGGDLQITAVY